MEAKSADIEEEAIGKGGRVENSKAKSPGCCDVRTAVCKFYSAAFGRKTLDAISKRATCTGKRPGNLGHLQSGSFPISIRRLQWIGIQ